MQYSFKPLLHSFEAWKIIQVAIILRVPENVSGNSSVDGASVL